MKTLNINYVLDEIESIVEKKNGGRSIWPRTKAQEAMPFPDYRSRNLKVAKTFCCRTLCTRKQSAKSDVSQGIRRIRRG